MWYGCVPVPSLLRPVLVGAGDGWWVGGYGADGMWYGCVPVPSNLLLWLHGHSRRSGSNRRCLARLMCCLSTAPFRDGCLGDSGSSWARAGSNLFIGSPGSEPMVKLVHVVHLWWCVAKRIPVTSVLLGYTSSEAQGKNGLEQTVQNGLCPPVGHWSFCSLRTTTKWWPSTMRVAHEKLSD